MQERSDNHNHIIDASLESMLDAARAKHISRFSITEHISQFANPRKEIPFSSFHLSGRMFGSFKEYLSEFERVNPPKDMVLRKGLEVDYLPAFEKELGNFVNSEEWDILLCSVHELSDRKDIETTDSTLAPREKWRQYVERQIQALQSDFIPFNVLTHPIRLVHGTPVNFPTEEVDAMLLDLANTARSSGKALELNGSDISYNSDLVIRLAVACGKAGCQVSLGSDAHNPRSVYQNLEVASTLVNKFSLSVKP